MERRQFTSRSLLLATAFIGIWLTAIKALNDIGVSLQFGRWDFHEFAETVCLTVFVAPFWMPVVFIGFALGRRSTVTLKMLSVLAVAQIIALCGVWAVYRFRYSP